MNKEELLQSLKDMILGIKSNYIPSSERIESLKKELAALNSDDSNWCQEEYTKWFHKEIRPFIPKKVLDIVNKKV